MLLGLGCALRTFPPGAISYYVCAMGLFILEHGLAEYRRTIQVGKVTLNEEFAHVEVLQPSWTSAIDVFYWIRGLPIPAVLHRAKCSVIRIPLGYIEGLENNTSVQVEGPYGPQIGMLSYLRKLFLRGILSLYCRKGDPLPDYRPARLISRRLYHFIVDDTTVARIFPLWLWSWSGNENSMLLTCFENEDCKAYQNLAGLEDNEKPVSNPEIFIQIEELTKACSKKDCIIAVAGNTALAHAHNQ